MKKLLRSLLVLLVVSVLSLGLVQLPQSERDRLRLTYS